MNFTLEYTVLPPGTFLAPNTNVALALPSGGLYRIVRCPNYFGEMLFWTGVFVGCVNCLSGVWQWVAVLAGYLGIIYVMFGGARRLEMRQNRTYGDDPEYQAYVKKTPIMVPLIPLYSVEKYKWLVA